MKIFQSKVKKFAGTTYGELFPQAFAAYKKLKKNSKRKPYIRSVYFDTDKIFLDYFWNHLHNKNNIRDKARRLKFYDCALDLIANSRVEPYSFQNPMTNKEILHRFAGLSKEGEMFYVQIKEDKRTDQKHFISVFPET